MLEGDQGTGVERGVKLARIGIGKWLCIYSFGEGSSSFLVNGETMCSVYKYCIFFPNEAISCTLLYSV